MMMSSMAELGEVGTGKWSGGGGGEGSKVTIVSNYLIISYILS